MPDPIDILFKDSIELPKEPLPLRQAEALQPATVSGIGELKGGSANPASMRLHDSEIALIITDDLMEPSDDPRIAALFPVRVTQIGGFTGDQDNQCSFTYNVYDIRGEVLGNSETTPITPEHPRPELGPMVAPAANAFGIGFYDEEDNFFLWTVGEVPDIELCI